MDVFYYAVCVGLAAGTIAAFLVLHAVREAEKDDLAE